MPESEESKFSGLSVTVSTAFCIASVTIFPAKPTQSLYLYWNKLRRLSDWSTSSSDPMSERVMLLGDWLSPGSSSLKRNLELQIDLLPLISKPYLNRI